MSQKKPAQHHHKNGNFRPSRHGGPAIPVKCPDLPPDLSPASAAHWHVIGRQLEDAGLICDVDSLFLRVLCDSAALYVEANDKVREQGLSLETDKGNPIQNPSLGARNTFVKQIVTLGKLFGMSPVARTGLHVDAKQEDDDVATILGLKSA